MRRSPGPHAAILGGGERDVHMYLGGRVGARPNGEGATLAPWSLWSGHMRAEACVHESLRVEQCSVCDDVSHPMNENQNVKR